MKPMTPLEARAKFAEIVKLEGKELVAARLGISVHQVTNLAEDQTPTLRTACAIEEVYCIPMNGWVEKPAAPVIGAPAR